MRGELPPRLSRAAAAKVERQAQGTGGRPTWVRLDRIDACPFQVRRVFPPEKIQGLADSILATGLIHPPHARPHPEREGWVQLMPGEMRVRALRLLVERGDAARVLRRGAENEWLAPVILRREDDDGAEATVFAENDERSDLSAWELALAWRARRDRRLARTLPAGVRELAAAYGKKYQTVAPYLAAADAVTPEVLAAAALAGADGDPQHERLSRLPLAALQRVTRAAAAGTTAAAERLLRELSKCGDREASALLVTRARALRGGDESAPPAGFQVNIRQPLASVAPRQAAAYLARLTPAVAALCARAATLEGGDASTLEPLADALGEAAVTLRRRR
jgi:ParB/RepB/Spo0J family partition protein